MMKQFKLVCRLQKNQITNSSISKKFSGVVPNHFWHLQIFPNNTSNQEPNNRSSAWLKVKVNTNWCPTSGLLADFSFVLKQSGREIHKVNGHFLFSKTKLQSRSYNIPLHDIHENEEFQMHVKGLAEFSSHELSESAASTKDSQRQIFYSMNLEHLLFLFESGDFSDVVIVVDGKEIKCHKCILSCRSPYFSALFKSGLSESVNNRIEITDFDYETIRLMIHFLYYFKYSTATVFKNSMQTYGISLLRASDKYQIDDLKYICEEYVMSTIERSNALDILLHADTYSALGVKEKAIDFICKNSNFFKMAEQYEPLINRPDLLRDLLLAKFNKGNAR